MVPVLNLRRVSLFYLLSFLKKGLVGVFLVPLLLVLRVLLDIDIILVHLVRIILDWVVNRGSSAPFLFLWLHCAFVINV